MSYPVGTPLLCTTNKNCSNLLTVGQTYVVISPPQHGYGAQQNDGCTWITADDEMPFLVNMKRFQAFTEEDI